jgi:hypothetical protein
MAAIANDRDNIMRTSPLRVVPVQAADQVIVPGFTGIDLKSDVGYWGRGPFPDLGGVWQLPTNGNFTGPREILTLIFSGMDPNPVITWDIGGATGLAYSGGKLTVTSFTVLPSDQHGIILSQQADPRKKIIEATSYPSSAAYPCTSGYMGHASSNSALHGCVRAKVTWGGTDFYAYKDVYTRGPGGMFPWG